MQISREEEKIDLVTLKTLFSQTHSPWGLSTWVDLHGCEKDLITSKKSIEKFVIELCDLLEVKRFGEAQIIEFGQGERLKGYSLTQLIETSLVSGHFVNFSRTGYIDIFSCKYYDPQKAFDHCLQFFKAEKGYYQFMLRK